jgi:ribosome-associated protein
MKHNFSPQQTTLHISREPIELYQVLKLGNMVGTGGEAKCAIAEGLVRHNGTVETRKKKKVVAGDTIEFEKKIIRIMLE